MSGISSMLSDAGIEMCDGSFGVGNNGSSGRHTDPSPITQSFQLRVNRLSREQYTGHVPVAPLNRLTFGDGKPGTANTAFGRPLVEYRHQIEGEAWTDPGS
ncbi:hypothetical protein PSPO01_00076 [Paraphaeosphaeria sporulosa]